MKYLFGVFFMKNLYIRQGRIDSIVFNFLKKISDPLKIKGSSSVTIDEKSKDD